MQTLCRTNCFPEPTLTIPVPPPPRVSPCPPIYTLFPMAGNIHLEPSCPQGGNYGRAATTPSCCPPEGMAGLQVNVSCHWEESINRRAGGDTRGGGTGIVRVGSGKQLVGQSVCTQPHQITASHTCFGGHMDVNC